MPRLNYIDRALAAMRDARLRVEPGRVAHTCIRHDDWCPLLKRNGSCTCNPQMLLLLDDKRRFQIKRNGTLKKAPGWMVCTCGFDPKFNRHFVN